MPSHRPTHAPIGDPCACGIPALRHRVEHKYEGDDYRCTRCGLPIGNHRIRFERQRQRINRRKRGNRRKGTDKENTKFIGIDGEGQGRADHRYTLLAASTEDGSGEWTACASRPKEKGLSTVECLDFILSLPNRRTKIFSFSFNYDITKIITDLPDRTIYRLMRPELPSRRRTGKAAFQGPRPVEWCPNGCLETIWKKGVAIGGCSCEGGAYFLNLQGTKFIVQRDKKRVVVWDLFKFFQAKFVNALKDWKVGDEVLWKRMSAMKDKRAYLDLETKEAVESYCLEECRCMGQLARKLIDAHEGAGLTLRSYYGAGSSGAAMLTAMAIKDKLAPTPEAMREAVAIAFSGGRFENTVIGAVREALEGWDISSAYVYQLAFLPCLQHGTWSHTTKRGDIEKAEAQSGALVRYTLRDNPGFTSWGPFPFRERDGSISYPIESGGGWVWLDEFLAGERIFAHVQFLEAWVYSSNCNCKPFGQIPEYYNLRLKIGKEGPGIVIKLGMNSCYGKLAQSIGNALFNSWIWAGMITSRCRAQILQLLGLHKDMSNMLMVATDGILTRERIVPPPPLETGTGDEFPDRDKQNNIKRHADGSIVYVRKPLGGWEAKNSDKGMFIARPGIYFPLEPTEEEIASIRARGVGRSVVLESWKAIVAAWESKGIDGVARVANVSRFCGAKTSISRSGDEEVGERYKRANGTPIRLNKDGHNVTPSYGQWVSREVALSFNPRPKRAYINPDGATLALRKFPKDQTSEPYRRATMRGNPEALELIAAELEESEQPECDLIDYESLAE